MEIMTAKSQFILIKKLLSDPKVKSFPVTVSGGSMRPAIRSGTIVRFHKLAGRKKLGWGDVVLVNTGRKFLVHRIILIKNSIKGKIYLTKGDFRLGSDGWWTRDQILAVRETKTIRQIIANYVFGVMSLVTQLIGAGLR